MPWANPIADPHDPSAIYVYADNDKVHAVRRVCFAQFDRAFATQTSTTVTVTVSGYGQPLRGNEVCPAIAHAPVPVRVVLPTPLGDRTLLDSTDTAHRVLDPTTVPAVTRFPQCPARSIRWDENTGAVSRTYAGGSGQFESQCAWLAYAHTAQIDPSGAPSPPMRINGRTVRVWTEPSGRLRSSMFTLEWTWPTGYKLQLVLSASRGHPLSRTQVQAIARSVH